MDSIGNMFGSGGGTGAGGFMPTTPDTGSFATGDITLGLPPGGSVETGPGGVAPGSVVSIPGQGGGGGGGISDILKVAGIIPTGINAIRGLFNRSPTEGNLARMSKLSTGAGKTASGLLSSYNQNQLTPTQQAAADQFEKAELAKWRQYLADAGIPESTAMVEIENKVRMDKQAFINNQLQQNFTNAMQATGVAQGSLTAQAAQNWAIDQASQKAMRDAMEAIGKIFGSGGEVT